jgi:hypothetical protein
MRTSRRLTQALLALCALVVMGTSALAADPGITFPWASEVSDQKAGSVLYYSLYASSASLPNRQNTRFNITNTSSTSAAFVHLYFVDGGTCSIADRYVCLTANQTLTFLASEQDPGTQGYLVAFAVDGVIGCPTSFNFLIGDYFVKLETNHQANFGAEAFSALYEGNVPGCDANSVTAQIAFNGVQYNRAPRVLAQSSIPSPLDGNVTRLAIHRVGGSLISGAGNTIGTLFGLLYNDREEPHSWNQARGCFSLAQLNNNFPKVSPRFDVVIPAGQTGWQKLWVPDADVAILGVQLNFNPNAGTAAGAFNGGHTLHKLTLSSAAVLTIPIFPPSC